MAQDCCPACGLFYETRCRCPRQDMRCPAGHRWHTCLVHGVTVARPAQHTRGGCTCPSADAAHPLLGPD